MLVLSPDYMIEKFEEKPQKNRRRKSTARSKLGRAEHLKDGILAGKVCLYCYCFTPSIS
jgi:hypothetical protein